jgi:hypothetical protein
LLTVHSDKTSTDIPVLLSSDPDEEQSEKFKLVLSDSINGILSSDSVGIGTINNVPAPYFLKMKVDGQQWTSNIPSHGAGFFLVALQNPALVPSRIRSLNSISTTGQLGRRLTQQIFSLLKMTVRLLSITREHFQF